MLSDVKITKCVQNERKEYSISLLIKERDITEQEVELLRQAKIN